MMMDPKRHQFLREKEETQKKRRRLSWSRPLQQGPKQAKREGKKKKTWEADLVGEKPWMGCGGGISVCGGGGCNRREQNRIE